MRPTQNDVTRQVKNFDGAYFTQNDLGRVGDAVGCQFKALHAVHATKGAIYKLRFNKCS